MSQRRFLDTNVLLRFLTGDDPVKASQARSLLLRVERGDEHVTTSPLVVFEVVFTLDRTYRVPRTQIRDAVRDLLMLSGLHVSERERLLDALDLFATHPRRISFADAYNVVDAIEHGSAELYPWDTDFDSFVGIVRVEPTNEAES